MSKVNSQYLNQMLIETDELMQYIKNFTNVVEEIFEECESLGLTRDAEQNLDMAYNECASLRKSMRHLQILLKNTEIEVKSAKAENYKRRPRRTRV